MNDGLIFVIGAPRSGTTLVRAMLNRHHRIALCDETYFNYWVAGRQRVFGDLSDPARRARAIDRYLETTRIRRLELDLTALREFLMVEATTYPRFLEAILVFYARSRQKTRAGEKTPQHAFIARKLLDWYPTARLVHIVRDPRDVVASMLRMPWGNHNCVLDARLWRACVAGAEECETDPRFLAVRYETLVAEPELQLRRICEFVGEQAEPGMLDGPGQTADRWWFARAQGAVEKGRVDLWKRELKPDCIAVVEWLAGDRLAKYGYEPSQPPLSKAGRSWAVIAAAAASLRRRARHLDAAYWHWMRPDQLAKEERAIDALQENR